MSNANIMLFQQIKLRFVCLNDMCGNCPVVKESYLFDKLDRPHALMLLLYELGFGIGFGEVNDERSF